MKNSLIIVALILTLVVLGCNLPSGTVREEKSEAVSTPQKTDTEENEKLKEKIAELEKEKLEEKIEELEKKVVDQKNQTSAKSTTKTKTSTTKPPKGFVRVNSPGDGFLALRTVPSAERGQRILKIPHGTFITVYNCTGVTVTSGKKGRWCQTVYEDNQGWVFDAYLTR